MMRIVDVKDSPTSDVITCAGGCKRSVKDEKAAAQAGWDHLPITRRYRCGQCWRELRAVNAPNPQGEDPT